MSASNNTVVYSSQLLELAFNGSFETLSGLSDDEIESVGVVFGIKADSKEEIIRCLLLKREELRVLVGIARNDEVGELRDNLKEYREENARALHSMLNYIKETDESVESHKEVLKEVKNNLEELKKLNGCDVTKFFHRDNVKFTKKSNIEFEFITLRNVADLIHMADVKNEKGDKQTVKDLLKQVKTILLRRGITLELAKRNGWEAATTFKHCYPDQGFLCEEEENKDIMNDLVKYTLKTHRFNPYKSEKKDKKFTNNGNTLSIAEQAIQGLAQLLNVNNNYASNQQQFKAEPIQSTISSPKLSSCSAKLQPGVSTKHEQQQQQQQQQQLILNSTPIIVAQRLTMFAATWKVMGVSNFIFNILAKGMNWSMSSSKTYCKDTNTSNWTLEEINFVKEELLELL
ncbi:hypothetical protein ABK040_011849 [Willaertia magna]